MRIIQYTEHVFLKEWGYHDVFPDKLWFTSLEIGKSSDSQAFSTGVSAGMSTAAMFGDLRLTMWQVVASSYGAYLPGN